MSSSDSVVIKTDLSPDKEKNEFIKEKLYQFNVEKVGKDEQYSIFAYHQDQIIGGVLVNAEKSSIFIEILWVDKLWRGQDIGSKLVLAAEQEGLNRNIFYSTTDTYSFQAVDFYIKNGYSEIGRIKAHIEGHDRVFFRKKLK
ncbi:MAG: GNAT family N-acetyltransferase [Gammaproteobacteria bacterium]|nr:GNAT family N-acetyltransferase [Gammaproteobacteria bacterium]